jgi:16S rRNA U1498 N3-methylase RsmE
LNYIYGLTLGKRILRADTAAISALTLLIDKKKYE